MIFINKVLLIIALMFTNFGAGFEHTFVNTLLPTIAYDLDGFDYFAWIGISYTLGNLVLLPMVGKLADRYNKMYLFIFGNMMLIVGSLLCVFSPNMISLIIARFVQGIGGGITTVMISIVVGITFSVAERVKWHVLFSVVYTTSVFLGPVIAGVLNNHLSWRMIFLSPIVIFTLSTILIAISGYKKFKDDVTKSNEPIRFWNNFLLILFIFLITLSISMIDGTLTIKAISSLFLSAIVFILFLKLEKKTEAKTFDFVIMKERIFFISLMTVLGSGYGKTIALTFIPMFAVIALQIGVDKAGYILIPIMIMSNVATYIAGKLLFKIQYKWIIFVSSLSIALGLYLFSFINQDTNYYYTFIPAIIMGIGVGGIGQPLLIMLQEYYGVKKMGVVSSTVTFSRWFGYLVGAATGATMLIHYAKKNLGASIIEKYNGNINKLYNDVYSFVGNNEKMNETLLNKWIISFQDLFEVSAYILLFFAIITLFMENKKLKK